MKNILFIVLVVFGSLKAQPPGKFYSTFGGGGEDIAYGVKETFGKNYAIVGLTTSFGAGNNDLYLLFIDSLGRGIWQKNYGGSGNEIGRGLMYNPIDSCLTLVGYSNSTTNGGYDIYVVHTNKDGDIIWQNKYGGNDWDFGYDIAQCSDGNIIVCGYSENSIYGKQDAFVLKINYQNGNIIWEKKFGGIDNDKLTRIFVDPTGGIYLVGSTSSYGDIHGDIYLLELNNNGDSLSSIIYGGPLADKANDIVVNNLGIMTLCGGSESFSTGKLDAFYAEFSSGGQLNWKKNYGYPGYDEEAFRLVYAPTAAAGGTYTSIYTTNEIPANGKDLKTIYMTYAGDFYGGGFSGSFGFSKDDETFDLIVTSDKGFAQVGYTESFGNNGKDILFIKQDSVLNHGASIVGNSEIFCKKHNPFLFPNPVQSGKGQKNIKIEGVADNDIIAVSVVNNVGHIISDEIIAFKKTDLTLDISGLSPGCYYIVVKGKEKTVRLKLLIT